MTCANCAMNIERILNEKVAGVVLASVNFATDRVYADVALKLQMSSFQVEA